MKQDEMNCLRGQLLGLEAILLELTPFRVPLKRQEIQDFYDNYFDWVSKPKGSISRHELRRHFNHKANQVQHLVDSAESLGNAADKLNLIYAACSLPGERTAPLNEAVERFCRRLINEAKIDERLLAVIEEASTHGAVELAARARLALATVYRRGGDRAGARVQLRAVLQDGARLDPVVLTESRIVLAELARDEGRPGVAVEACRLAVSAAERTGPAHALWRARRLLGAALWDAGDTAAGEQLLQDVAGLTRTNGARPELARTLADWTARRAAGQHKPDETAALRRELADLAESLSR